MSDKEKTDVAKKEEEILDFWKKNKIFEKSLEKGGEEFIFYDGPPFATGLPHYGHLLQSFIKDALPRYKTMRGYCVPRRWGWDCHGLPLENVVEKKLNLKTKKDIEEYGIDKFNDVAKNSVLRYADDWRKIIPRVGRWVDMDNDYRTMDWKYTETVWWIFKNLYDKGLIYEGYKSMHLCPRCETTLSNFEVNQGYKDIKDFSVTVKLELEDEPGTFLLAWTTTPWTLPGNMAAAINKELLYLKIKQGNEKFILAEDMVTKYFPDFDSSDMSSYEQIISPEKDLIGKSYKPPFDYYKDREFKNKENAWKIWHADYVSNEEGTGLVHIAPAFGADDMDLAQANNIPIVHHVGMNGRFTDEVIDFAGRAVKPRDDKSEGVDHMSADIEIIKKLAHDGILFAKEKIEHSYPHCWRCDTPLLNYASDSWFVKVSEIKKKIISENKKVGWVPEHIRDGRFGKGLESAPDWAISRSRYWGAPLPVWRCDECKTEKVLDSVADLMDNPENKITKVILIRHGESEKNVQRTYSSAVDKYPLTKKGIGEAEKTAKQIATDKPDKIFSSPILRARQTAEIIGKKTGVKVSFDDELKEVDDGEWEEKTFDEREKMENRKDYLKSDLEGYYTTKRGKNGESWEDLEKRSYAFLKKIVSENSGKTIVIVSHQGTSMYILKALQDLTMKETVRLNKNSKIIGYAHPIYSYVNSETCKEINLHRPYIDQFRVVCDCGVDMERIPEVFDCWFESGSMPYGQMHYPFENKDKFDPEKGVGYSADFIAESLEQTRGWFYSLIVLGVGLFGKSPYENVIASGLILAEDGQKMSKKLQNYPDPIEMVDKYGADAVRFYLSSSPLVRGEDLNFSEKGLAEVYRKIILRLENVFSFYETYADKDAVGILSTNILDKWILSRLNETIELTTKSLEQYELDRAMRPIDDFIEDLSVWYIRRSRDRFKSNDDKDREFVASTTREVIGGLVKIMAPIVPFVSETIYQELRKEGDIESVHLCEWPEVGDVDEDILGKMKVARDLVSLGLEKRAGAGIKVRQPLQSVKLRGEKLPEEYIEIIKEELNVREVLFDKNLEEDAVLDTELTKELREEGRARELIRNLQGLRKEMGLTPDQSVRLLIDGGGNANKLIEKFSSEIKRVVGVSEISFERDSDAVEVEIEGETLSVKIIV